MPMQPAYLGDITGPSATPLHSQDRVLRWIQAGALALLAFSLCLYLVRVYAGQNSVLDDAYITFRFARNLATGHGLVWNPGGEHVEGFTSMLHVLLLSWAMRLGIPASIADIGIGVASVLGTVVLLLTAMRRQWGWWGLAASLVSVYLTDPNTASLTTAGLETHLFILCLCTAYVSALAFIDRPEGRAAYSVSAAVFFSILCRPDGVLYALGLYAALGLYMYRVRHVCHTGVRRLQWSILALTAAGFLYALWKYRYFGYLLPNPFYVKSNRISLNGLSYVTRYTLHLMERIGPLVLVIVLICPLAGLLKMATAARSQAKLLVTLLPPCLSLAYYLTILHEVGGFHRFSYPTYFYFIAAVCGLAYAAATWGDGRRAIPLALCGIGLVLVSFLVDPVALNWKLPFRPAPVDAFNTYHFKIAEALRQTGLGSKASIICDAAGIIPFVSGFNQVDRVGLTDNYLSGRQRHTPREREDYIWTRNADVYIGYEPPARPGSLSAEDDQRGCPNYINRLNTHKRVTIEERTFPPTPELLHHRMALLRDEWVYAGNVDWPGSSLWGLRSFIYVRKESPYRNEIITRLAAIAVKEDERELCLGGAR